MGEIRGRKGWKQERRRDRLWLPLVSYWASHLLLVNSSNFFKGSSPPPFFFFFPPSKQNSGLHFLCKRRDPTLQVESKGRKAIPSVLVIKRICIMNHMPKGPVLHVGQIFVWIFNFYIQMKHSVQSTNSAREHTGRRSARDSPRRSRHGRPGRNSFPKILIRLLFSRLEQ